MGGLCTRQTSWGPVRIVNHYEARSPQAEFLRPDVFLESIGSERLPTLPRQAGIGNYFPANATLGSGHGSDDYRNDGITEIRYRTLDQRLTFARGTHRISLHEMLQILSLTMFERMPLNQLLTKMNADLGIEVSANQLNLFD